jgi:hypothetical protein
MAQGGRATVVAIGLLLAAVLLPAAAPGAEKEAVAAIEKLGGKVKRCAKAPGSPVVEVDLNCCSLTDADLVHLQSFRQLERLGLVGCGIKGEGLVHLQGLTNLRNLDLDSTKVSHAGLAYLEGLGQLRELRLSQTAVTDADLAHLKGYGLLRTLDLRGTAITDKGLAWLKSLRRLRSLDLDLTNVTARGVRELERELPQLEIEHSARDNLAAEGASLRGKLRLPPGWPVQLVEGKNAEPPPAHSVKDILGWLPPRTETLAVMPGPFVVAGTDPETGDKGPLLEKMLQGLSLSMLDIRDGAYRKLVAGQTVALAVEGSRRFRPPSGLGSWRYDGCHIIVFRENLGPTAVALGKALAADADRVIGLSGHPVFLFNEKWEKDRWTIFIAVPEPNVVLCATDEYYLQEVLERRAQHARPAFLDDRFAGWQRLDRKGHFWAMHYSKRAEEGVTRVALTCNPADKTPARARYLAAYPEALNGMAKYWHDVGHGITAHARRPRPGVLNVRFSLQGEEAEATFLFLLLGLLGQGICC